MTDCFVNADCGGTTKWHPRPLPGLMITSFTSDTVSSALYVHCAGETETLTFPPNVVQLAYFVSLVYSWNEPAGTGAVPFDADALHTTFIGQTTNSSLPICLPRVLPPVDSKLCAEAATALTPSADTIATRQNAIQIFLMVSLSTLSPRFEA